MMKMTEKIKSGLTAMGILLTLAFISCAPHYYYLSPAVKPLTPETIITLAGEGRTDQEIIRRIDESGTVIFLRTEDILRLHKEGVSKPVIDHLIAVKEWALLASPVIYDEVHPGRTYQLPRSYRDSRQPRSLVPIAVH